MPYTPKAWQDEEEGGTELDAAALIDLETRLAGYADDTADAAARDRINAQVDHGAVGDGSADDTTALQAAINAAAQTGRTLYLPPGDYVTGELTSTFGAVRIAGEPGGRTRLRLNAVAAGAAKTLLRFNGAPGAYEIADLEIAAPAGLVATASARGIGMWSHAARLQVRNVTFTGLTYGVKVDPDAGGDVDLVVRGCRFIGGADIGGKDSLGILMSPPAGRLTVTDKTVFEKMGQLGSGGNHALYVYDHIDTHVHGCQFRQGYGYGFGVHFYGGSAAARFHRVTNCDFDYGVDSTGNSMQAVLVSKYTPLDMRGCALRTYGQAVTWSGIAYIRDCRFTGTGGSAFRMRNGTALGPVVAGIIEGCVFEGAQFNDVVFDATNFDVTVRRNRFLGASQRHVNPRAAGRLRVIDNEFRGAALRAIDSGGVPLNLQVLRNEFVNPGQSIALYADMTRFLCRDNDLSNAGADVQYVTAQTAADFSGNYGSNAGAP